MVGMPELTQTRCWDTRSQLQVQGPGLVPGQGTPVQGQAVVGPGDGQSGQTAGVLHRLHPGYPVGLWEL